MARPRSIHQHTASLSELEAHAFAAALQRVEGIAGVSVRRLMVGARSDEPTEWFLVTVPPRAAMLAERCYRWWREGILHARIERHRSYSGTSYANAAHALGYGEIMPEGK